MRPMADHVLIHGGGCSPWHWHLLEAELRRRGHRTVAVDLPCEDESAGLDDYAEAIAAAAAGLTDPVLVAHSLAGISAPLACTRLPAGLLVLLTAMVPAPGEPPAEWWAATGHEAAVRAAALARGEDPDQADLFFADLPSGLAREAGARLRGQADAPFGDPWPLEAWPDVRTAFLLCRDDRFFPAPFIRRVVRERLGITPAETPGGHFAMLSRPRELADRLEALAPSR